VNWDAVGAIAEAIGAGAVVATLVYFGVQLRQTQRASQDTGSLVSMNLNSAWRRTLLENGELAETLSKANSGNELTDKEAIQLNTLAQEIFFAIAMSWTYSIRAGAFHEEMGEVKYLTSILLANPGLIPEWHRLKDQVDLVAPDLREEMDRKINEQIDG
jgi:hypothetical protein